VNDSALVAQRALLDLLSRLQSERVAVQRDTAQRTAAIDANLAAVRLTLHLVKGSTPAELAGGEHEHD